MHACLCFLLCSTQGWAAPARRTQAMATKTPAQVCSAVTSTVPHVWLPWLPVPLPYLPMPCSGLKLWCPFYFWGGVLFLLFKCKCSTALKTGAPHICGPLALEQRNGQCWAGPASCCAVLSLMPG
jgi:hypothetical protein